MSDRSKDITKEEARRVAEALNCKPSMTITLYLTQESNQTIGLMDLDNDFILEEPPKIEDIIPIINTASTDLEQSQSDLNPNRSTHTLTPEMIEHEIGNDMFIESMPTATFQSMPTQDTTSDYTVGDVIGEGGMGIVYLAEQAIPNRHVAIKRLKTKNSALAKALLQEAMTTGSLEHPNIIPIHSVNLKGPHAPEVVMKRVQGLSISDTLKDEALRHDELKESLGHLQQVCQALEFAHSRKIIHRDIKPENIMIGSFGEVYLLDWGLAIHLDERAKTRRGLVGTPAYMAPEMISGDPLDVDERTDVYLLGSTLHEFLTGKKRHSADSIKGALQQAEASIPYQYDSSVLKELGDLANSSCNKDKEQRPQTVSIFRDRIEDIQQHWEALSIANAADEKLARLKDICKTGFNEDRNIEVHQLYSQARFGFEQALNIFPQCLEAINGRQENLKIMAEWAIESDQLKLAQTILEEITDDVADLHSTLQNRLNKYEKEKQKQARDAEIAESYSREHSNRSRKLIAFSMIGLCFPLVIGVIVHKFINNPVITPSRLLITTGVVSLGLMIFVFLGRKGLLYNSVGRGFAIAMCTGALGMLLNVLGAILYYPTLPQEKLSDMVMMVDVIIVGITFSNAYPALRNGLQIGICCLILSLVCTFFPQTAHACLLLSCLIATSMSVSDWLKEQQIETNHIDQSAKNKK